MIWKDNVHLLVGARVIESEQSTSLLREEAFKPHTEPIIGPGDREFSPDREPQGVGSGCVPVMVIRGGGRFRMWFRCAA